MSENATRISDGENVKIGTCESMYYLRFDQRGDVSYPWPELSDDPERLDPFLYRFPDPREDGTLSGEYDGAWGGVKLSAPGFWATFGDKFEHGAIQATSHDGYLFNLPCPEGKPEAYPGDYGKTPQVHRNGGTATVKIVAQRWYAGSLVLVVQCAACGRLCRLPELEDAEPILAALEAEAKAHRREADLYRGSNRAEVRQGMYREADYWAEAAHRVRAGYARKLEAGTDNLTMAEANRTAADGTPVYQVCAGTRHIGFYTDGDAAGEIAEVHGGEVFDWATGERA